MNRDTQERWNPLLKQRPIFVAAITALALINLGGAASAQSAPAPLPQMDVQVTNDAPVARSTFRVQPRPSDLPPGVAETETRRTEQQKLFDKRLQICRTC